MRQRVSLIVLAAFLYALPVRAEMKLFPMWEQKKCPEETFACYDFETSKKILKLDLDLQLKLDKLGVCVKDRLDLQTANKKLTDANKLLESNAVQFDERLKEKDETLVKNTNLMIKYQSRDVFGGALPWVIVIVVVVAAGGFAGGYYLGSR
jgi:hypothetical protein